MTELERINLQRGMASATVVRFPVPWLLLELDEDVPVMAVIRGLATQGLTLSDTGRSNRLVIKRAPVMP